jgi:hypothetical protein
MSEQNIVRRSIKEKDMPDNKMLSHLILIAVHTLSLLSLILRIILALILILDLVLVLLILEVKKCGSQLRYSIRYD